MAEWAWCAFRLIVCDEEMEKKLLILSCLIVQSFAVHLFGQGDASGIEDLEEMLYDQSFGVDDLEREDLPRYVPWRERDGLAKYQHFIPRKGWTTNRFVNALIFLATNNLAVNRWRDDRCSRVAAVSLGTLAEIDCQQAQSFVRQICTNAVPLNFEGSSRFIACTLPGVFCRTNFEPEVFDYLRQVCVLTNRYEECSVAMTYHLKSTLCGIPLSWRSDATTNLCRYIYFVIHNVSYGPLSQDHELVNLLPAYSNSIQRIRALEYIANSNTNESRRVKAQRKLDSLLRIPTNELNDLSWITGN